MEIAIAILGDHTIVPVGLRKSRTVNGLISSIGNGAEMIGRNPINNQLFPIIDAHASQIHPIRPGSVVDILPPSLRQSAGIRILSLRRRHRSSHAHGVHRRACLLPGQLGPGHRSGPIILILRSVIFTQIGKVSLIQINTVIGGIGTEPKPQGSAFGGKGRHGIAAPDGRFIPSGKTAGIHRAIPGPADIHLAHAIALVDGASRPIAACKAACIGIGQVGLCGHGLCLGRAGMDIAFIEPHQTAQIDDTLLITAGPDLSAIHSTVFHRAAVIAHQPAHIEGLGAVPFAVDLEDLVLIHLIDHILKHACAVAKQSHIRAFFSVQIGGGQLHTPDLMEAAIVIAPERTLVAGAHRMLLPISSKQIIGLVNSIIQVQMLQKPILVLAGKIGIKTAQIPKMPGGPKEHRQLPGHLIQIQSLFIVQNGDGIPGIVGKMRIVIVLFDHILCDMLDGDLLIKIRRSMGGIHHLCGQGEKVIVIFLSQVLHILHHIVVCFLLIGKLFCLFSHFPLIGHFQRGPQGRNGISALVGHGIAVLCHQLIVFQMADIAAAEAIAAVLIAFIINQAALLELGAPVSPMLQRGKARIPIAGERQGGLQIIRVRLSGAE